MRRLATLKVTPELILGFCRAGKSPSIVARNPIPDDARVVGVALGARDLVFTLESREFAPLGALDPVPELPAPVVREAR